MTQRKEEADSERPLSPLQHVAHGIVDGGDMVRIEGMAQSEHVGDEAQAHQRGMLRRVVKIKPPANHVQQRDNAVQTRQAYPFAAGEHEY